MFGSLHLLMARDVLVLLVALLPGAAGKGCTAVKPDKCGKTFYNSCLKCGSKSDWDCEKCCPGCKLVSKGTSNYCQCTGPGPAPPPPGGDTWNNYRVANMDVLSVTGGHNKSNYEQVVILLHGGGLDGKSWEYNYNSGWFGNLTGLKFVFPTSPLPAGFGYEWFITYKNGCGLDDDCAYNISSIRESAARVAALIEHEKQLVAGDASKVFLGGFSEGAQLAAYMQLASLDFALGGTIVMDGFPLPPLCDMPGGDPAAAKKNATYFGADMRWMIWHGEDDPIFPANFTLTRWNGIFRILGVSSTLKIEHLEPGMTHTMVKAEFAQLQSFVRTTAEAQSAEGGNISK